jgi:hypothetical protein
MPDTSHTSSWDIIVTQHAGLVLDDVVLSKRE